MAELHLAQIAHLSQQLIDHLKNVYNLNVRSKTEIELVQKTLKILLTVCDEWLAEKEAEAEQKSPE